jgi:serine phosphatase RsbU (regulator of sigma subunit)
LFNFANNTLSYSRAGHCPILYYSANAQKAHYLQSNGLGLGIIRNQSYSQYIETKTLELTIGDVFVIYTDGLIEGNSPTNNEPYGFERLKDCLESCYHLSAQEIKTFIFDDYSQYSHKITTKDDTTLLVIKIDYLLHK